MFPGQDSMIMRYLFLIIIILSFQSAQPQVNYKETLPKNYFACEVDSDCVLVSGWCQYFAINKSKLRLFNEIIDHKKNSQSTCPAGWVPMRMPTPNCIKKQCSTSSEN